jgi:hypothetical protein
VAYSILLGFLVDTGSDCATTAEALIHTHFSFAVTTSLNGAVASFLLYGGISGASASTLVVLRETGAFISWMFIVAFETPAVFVFFSFEDDIIIY